MIKRKYFYELIRDSQQVWHLFAKRFRLVPLFLLSIGILISAYFVVGRIQSVLAFNDTTQTWTFNAANATNYTYDSTLVTVDNSGARPVTGVNKITNPAFTSNNNSWSLAAVAGSTTPAGWVVVPGSPTYSTSDFLVMKYEAKCASTSAPTVGLTTPDSGYHTYSDSTTPCTNANSKQVVSVASGYPVARVSQIDAITRCSTVSVVGNATHLINNNEWQTIARNAEAQPGNWSLGAVGSGYLFAGHNDNAPALALPASTTDTGNYACAYTDTAGTTEAPSSCPTNTASGTSGTAGNQKRVLTLSNGQPIWDIAGSVWEWTNNTIQRKDQPVAWNGTTDDATGWVWSDYSSGSSARYIHTYKAGSSMQQVNMGPLNTSYNANQGIGRIYHYSNLADADTTVYAFRRGGQWNNASSAGAFSGDSVSPGVATSSIGIRCASDPLAISQSFSSSSGRGAAGGDSVVVASVTDAKIYQSVNVGDTSTYDFSVYVHDSTAGNVGGTVTSSIAQLYYNGATITTSYSDAGSGWWKLSGTLTGANASREYGVRVKSGKTVVLDDFTLSKSGTYSVYATAAYSNAQVFSWDSFTPTVTASGNATVGYQVCLDNGSACSYSSGSRWQYYTGGVWTNATDATQTNTGAQLTQAAMQALSTASKKITVKAVMGFRGADTPSISSIAIGLTPDIAPPIVPGTPTTTTPTIKITNLGLISNVPDKASLMYYFTSQTPYIQGVTEASSVVHFEYNGHDYIAIAGTDGKYAISISNPDLPRTSVTLTYYSIDLAGNKSAERTLTLIIGIENFPPSVISTPNDVPTSTAPTPTVTDTSKPVSDTPTPIIPTITTLKVEDENGNLLVNATVTIDKQKYVSDSKGQIYLEGTPSSNSQITVEYNGKTLTGSVVGDTIIAKENTTSGQNYTWLIILILIIAGLSGGVYLYRKKRQE